MPEPLTWNDLLRYHREFWRPDMEGMFSRFDQIDTIFDAALPHFQNIYNRLDRLIADCQALRERINLGCDIAELQEQTRRLRERFVKLKGGGSHAGVARDEQLRQEIDGLKSEVAVLRERVTEMERRLDV